MTTFHPGAPRYLLASHPFSVASSKLRALLKNKLSFNPSRTSSAKRQTKKIRNRKLSRRSPVRDRSRDRHSRNRSKSRSGSRNRHPRHRSSSPSRHRHSRRRSRSRSRSGHRHSRRRSSRSRDRYSRRGSTSRDRVSRQRSGERSKRSGSPERGKKQTEVRNGGRKEGGFDFAKLIEAENDETMGKGSGWERFDFNVDAPLDDEEVEAGEDDAVLVKHIGQSFRFSAVERREEEEIKAAHDEAMFGASSFPLPAESNDESEDRPQKETVETTPVSQPSQ